MSRPLRVLVIDDDPLIVAIIEIHLTAQGYSVDCVSDGAAGIAHIRHKPPDAIVLDTSMPLLDGHQVLQVLQSEASLASIPVIMLTAAKREHDVMEAFRFGAKDYLIKPFKGDELVARVSRLLH